MGRGRSSKTRRLKQFESLEARTLLAADLSVSIEIPDSVRRTEELTYTIHVANHGPDKAIAQIELPELALYQVDVTSSNYISFAPLPTLRIASGEEISLDVSGFVPFDAEATISDSVTVTPVGSEDPDLTNNRATFDLQVLDVELASEVDVAVAVARIGSDELAPGDMASFTVQIANNGLTHAHDVRLTTLFGNLLSATWNSDELSVDGEGPIDVTLNLFPGQTVSYSIDAIVGRELTSYVGARIAPAADQIDLTPEGNQSETSSLVPLRQQASTIIGNVSVCYEETYVLDGVLYFVGLGWGGPVHCYAERASASSGFYGGTLWRTDGTASGTYAVKDIRPGLPGEPGPWDPFQFTKSRRPEFLEYNGLLYFIADDGFHGGELWRSDGTEDGTYLVKDINPTIADDGDRWPFFQFFYNQASEIEHLQVLDDKLAFVAFDGTSRTTWVSDGTEAGTRKADELVLESPPPIQVDRPTVDASEAKIVLVNEADGRLNTVLVEHSRPVRMPIVAWDDTVIFNNSELVYQSTPLYAIDVRVDSVEIDAPVTFSNRAVADVRRSFATEIVSFASLGYDETLPILDWKNPFNALGNEPTVYGIAQPFGRNELSQITLRFPALIVDGPGPDIEVGISTWSQPPDGLGLFEVIGITPGDEEHILGNISADKPSIDIAAAGHQGPFESLRVVRTASETFQAEIFLTSVEATIEASTVLTAAGPNNLDNEYSWDLNNDGVFGDRVGPSVGLSRSELDTWGISQPGEYPISVRRNDRVNDYFDETTFTVLEEETLDIIAGDIDGNGQVDFADFLILSSNYGIVDPSRDDGDVNGDSEVGFTDFVILLQNFGERR